MSEIKGSYLIALAAVAGIALFMIGAYEMDFKTGNNDDSDEPDLSNSLEGTLQLTIGPNIMVVCNGEDIFESGVITAVGDTLLKITVLKDGMLKWAFHNNGAHYIDTKTVWVSAGDTFTLELPTSTITEIDGNISLATP